jgi:hypothetical protein
MEEMAKHSRKTSTREGSLLESTATSFFTCRIGHPSQSGELQQGRQSSQRGQNVQVTGTLLSMGRGPCLSQWEAVPPPGKDLP